MLLFYQRASSHKLPHKGASGNELAVYKLEAVDKLGEVLCGLVAAGASVQTEEQLVEVYLIHAVLIEKGRIEDDIGGVGIGEDMLLRSPFHHRPELKGTLYSRAPEIMISDKTADKTGGP